MLTHQESQPQVPKWRVKASSSPPHSFLSILSFLFSLSLFLSLSLLLFSSSPLPLSLLPTQILKSIRYAFDWYTVCTAITACTGRVCTIHLHLRLPPQSSHVIPILPVILLLILPLADAHENCSCSCSVLQSTWLRGWVEVRTVKGEMKGLRNLRKLSQGWL